MIAGVGTQLGPQRGLRVWPVSSLWAGGAGFPLCCPVTRQANRSLTPSTRWRWCGRGGLEVSLRDLLERGLFQLGIGQQPLECGVLPLKVFEPLGVIGFESTELTWAARLHTPRTNQPGSGQGYLPSAALARSIRCRDLACRFPDCEAPAAVCEIDHTIPYPVGPTHPSNLKLLCVFHHQLKTSWGWHDRQLPDATVVWTSPQGEVKLIPPMSATNRPPS